MAHGRRALRLRPFDRLTAGDAPFDLAHGRHGRRRRASLKLDHLTVSTSLTASKGSWLALLEQTERLVWQYETTTLPRGHVRAFLPLIDLLPLLWQDARDRCFADERAHDFFESIRSCGCSGRNCRLLATSLRCLSPGNHERIGEMERAVANGSSRDTSLEHRR